MNPKRLLLALLLLALPAVAAAMADEYARTVAIFKSAGSAGTFFDDCYGYAVFPTIGKGALFVGFARGSGRVYVQGQYVGDAAMTQLTFGAQVGGQAYSQIVFFRDRRAFDEFSNGNFEFSAQAEAVAATAAVGVAAATTGNRAVVSGGQNDASARGRYYKGLAVFTVAKGGFMVEASVGGQKFSYRSRRAPGDSAHRR